MKNAFAYRSGTAAGYATGVSTSREAAALIDRQLNSRQREVIAILFQHGPLTGEQVASFLRRPTYTVLPRLTELAKQGVAERTGERRKNFVGGGDGHVWRLRRFSRTGPLVCKGCNGAGGVEIDGPEPDSSTELICDDCDGSGTVHCSDCGEHDAMEYVNDEPVCSACAQYAKYLNIAIA
jgi:hypothetical protein